MVINNIRISKVSVALKFLTGLTSNSTISVRIDTIYNNERHRDKYA